MPLFFLLCLAFVIVIPSIALAENYVGIIIDGYQNDCNVRSRGVNYDCKEFRHLYAGDIVTKKPNIRSVQIKWAPYASGSVKEPTSLVVIFEPPKDGKGMVLRMKEVLGLLRTDPMKRVGATRGAGTIPQPGNNATLILDEISTFEWESEGGRDIVFKNTAGNEIFKKDVANTSSVQLSPRQIGMKPGRTYIWSVSRIRESRQSIVRVLSADMALRVTSGLKDIEKELAGAVEKILMRAVYLQFISDSYPQELDVYWLSYLILSEARNETLTEDESRLVDYLKRNYLEHVKTAM
jgi:hypothetical protein